MDEPQSFIKAPPRLLVSVRDVSEVASAIAGGCDIVDVKDPARGSLGRADPLVWSSITHELKHANANLPCSVALGEIVETKPSVDSLLLPSEAEFAKLGTAELGALPDWQRVIAESRKIWEQHARSYYRWVLVVYADYQSAHSPSLAELCDRLPEILATGDWDGVLIDTFTKNGRSLLDCIEASQLIELSEIVRQAQKLWCVAGSLHVETLSTVMRSHPDVIGIRTAGCRDGRRDQPIDASAVRGFRNAMNASFEATIRPYAENSSHAGPRISDMR